MAKGRITEQSVAAIEAGERDKYLWDPDLAGFGLKVTSAGRRVYLAQYRTPGGRRGRTRRVTIGRHGAPWTPDLARAEAERLLAEVKCGGDPAGTRSQSSTGAAASSNDRKADRPLDGAGAAEILQAVAGALVAIAATIPARTFDDRMAVANQIQHYIDVPGLRRKMEIIRKAEDPSAPGHAKACGVVMAAAYLAGVKWLPPQETIQRWLDFCSWGDRAPSAS